MKAEPSSSNVNLNAVALSPETHYPLCSKGFEWSISPEMSSSLQTACLVLWTQTSSTSYFTLFLVDIPCMVLASPVSWLSWLLGCSRGCTLTIGLFMDTDPHHRVTDLSHPPSAHRLPVMPPIPLPGVWLTYYQLEM